MRHVLGRNSNGSTQSVQTVHSAWWWGGPDARPIDDFLTVEQGKCASARYSSADGGRRARLRSATCRLPAKRLRTAEADGRVGRRGGGGGFAASSRRSSAAAHAVARLRNWDREPADEAVITGPATLITRSRTAAENSA